MIKVKEGTVIISEQTLRELLTAVEKRKETPIDETPMPEHEGDIDQSTIDEENFDRGRILVKSEYNGVKFQINIEKPSQDERSESSGYKLSPPESRMEFPVKE